MREDDEKKTKNFKSYVCKIRDIMIKFYRIFV